MMQKMKTVCVTLLTEPARRISKAFLDAANWGRNTSDGGYLDGFSEAWFDEMKTGSGSVATAFGRGWKALMIQNSHPYGALSGILSFAGVAALVIPAALGKIPLLAVALTPLVPVVMPFAIPAAIGVVFAAALALPHTVLGLVSAVEKIFRGSQPAAQKPAGNAPPPDLSAALDGLTPEARRAAIEQLKITRADDFAAVAEKQRIEAANDEMAPAKPVVVRAVAVPFKKKTAAGA